MDWLLAGAVLASRSCRSVAGSPFVHYQYAPFAISVAINHGASDWRRNACRGWLVRRSADKQQRPRLPLISIHQFRKSFIRRWKLTDARANIAVSALCPQIYTRLIYLTSPSCRVADDCPTGVLLVTYARPAWLFVRWLYNVDLQSIDPPAGLLKIRRGRIALRCVI